MGLVCNGADKSDWIQICIVAGRRLPKDTAMNAEALVALLPAGLDVIFAGENAHGGRHRLSAVNEVFVPGFVAEPEDSPMRSRFDHEPRLRFLHSAPSRDPVLQKQ